MKCTPFTRGVTRVMAALFLCAALALPVLADDESVTLNDPQELTLNLSTQGNYGENYTVTNPVYVTIDNVYDQCSPGLILITSGASLVFSADVTLTDMDGQASALKAGEAYVAQEDLFGVNFDVTRQSDDETFSVDTTWSFQPIPSSVVSKEWAAQFQSISSIVAAEDAAEEPSEEPAEEPSEEPADAVLTPETPAEAPQASETALPTASSVSVDGAQVAFDAYNINGSNYFKLRDLAFALNGSAKQFDVGWDSANNAISLTSGAAYTVAGGEMTSGGTEDKAAVPTGSSIFLDDAEITFDAYNIDGSNYFKLRDIGAAFDFGVDWDGELNAIAIDTSKGYTAE